LVVRVLTQQQILNFVFADMEQNGGQAVFFSECTCF
jgi:hypothetical protein